ncbi:Na+/H+ antiporter subunit [Thermogladius calderae 1633]|uniref:Na+/H+ antiporter subunit n=1 Tax=Thermogladius calderae (strain DSM 22663 / VKM B-2946 / 1633) TaxID=1184251 RepID=I3TG06_THEC1|nr:hydrogenase subunit MbhD domain-containing protein [Thermogladius calderae]AFK51694.1 Na+/H+ antiporter subunit [Thermogladius calderae 1633]
MSLDLLIYAVGAAASLMSVVAVYLALVERDLVKAVIYSAIQSVFYSLLFYLFMSPDIVLVYLPVAGGVLPALLLVLISKTERFERE